MFWIVGYLVPCDVQSAADEDGSASDSDGASDARGAHLGRT